MLALTLAAALWNTLCNGYPVDQRGEFLFLNPQLNTVLRSFCFPKSSTTSLFVYANPKLAEILPRISRAVLRENDGNLIGAIEDYSFIVEKGGPNAWAQEHLEHCRGLLRNGQARLNMLLMAVRVGPGKFIGTYEREAANCDTGTRRLLIYLLNAHIKAHPADDSALCLRGLFLQIDGRFEDAIQDYRTYRWNHPREAEPNRYLAIALQRTGNLLAALDNARQVVRLNEGDAYDQYLLSNYLAANKDFEEAIQAATKAIESSPNYAAAYYLRGLCRANLKQHALALADLSKATEDNDWHECAQHALCLAKVAAGDFDGALADANDVVARRNASYAFDLRFRVHCARNNLMAAIIDGIQEAKSARAEKLHASWSARRNLQPMFPSRVLDLSTREQDNTMIAPTLIVGVLTNDRKLTDPSVTYLNHYQPASRLEYLARGLYFFSEGKTPLAQADFLKVFASHIPSRSELDQIRKKQESTETTPKTVGRVSQQAELRAAEPIPFTLRAKQAERIKLPSDS
ncbi:hypothetical protein BH10PLA2_BH10PLA2_02940 [soil metagenome]